MNDVRKWVEDSFYQYTALELNLEIFYLLARR